VRKSSLTKEEGVNSANGLPLPPAHMMVLVAGSDCIYAISVFTHLSAELQDLWMKELRRIVRPGGHLLITTHGESFRARRGRCSFNGCPTSPV
jgi:hypothetical protein